MDRITANIGGRFIPFMSSQSRTKIYKQLAALNFSEITRHGVKMRFRYRHDKHPVSKKDVVAAVAWEARIFGQWQRGEAASISDAVAEIARRFYA
jgi:hypothetical protein